MGKVREYVPLWCGSCYRRTWETDDVARYYSCVRCGEPSVECVTCARIARERQLLEATVTCAACSIREEIGPDPS